jgi:hypothetical protein
MVSPTSYNVSAEEDILQLFYASADVIGDKQTR